MSAIEVSVCHDTNQEGPNDFDTYDTFVLNLLMYGKVLDIFTYVPGIVCVWCLFFSE